ncbi:uncharacterized protein LOC113312758 [Papaver somniferum]|uniref:uncharacterized protein LOC113312758 n=1 Tax=Papaver somniferum TaxID=3469 RepID=UPI000E6FA6A1|nr:uncharacterized protein LOC113312758 [Papaver somniferum]
MRVLYWNINGIARHAARCKLQDLLKEFKPDIFCIAEPKVYCTVRFMQGLHIDGYKKEIIHSSLVFLKGTSGFSGRMIWLHRCFQVHRRRLWQQLSSSDISIPWLVIGDFNCVLRNVEKKRGREPRTSVINEFSNWMEDNDLFEAYFLGSNFTWANGQSGVRRILCKLDRAIINEAWLSKFENWRCKDLPREVFDHSPLIGFTFANSRPKRAPFRVQKMWFSHPDFMRMVIESWNAPVSGSPAFIFTFKLKRLKASMKECNLRVFGNVYAKLKQEKLTMEVALRISDEDPEDITKLNYAKEASMTLQEIRSQQSIMSSNLISELVDENGNVLTDYDQIRNHTVSFFESKFNGDELPIDEDLFHYDHNIISSDDSQRMNEIPIMEEIKIVVFDLGADSAPGPDDFSGCFYRHCWDVIQQDLYNAITFCWSEKIIPQGTNSSLLILLAKVRGSNTLRNFRPIGLSNFFFKIITKILATRLGSVLDNLVSEEQVAFMKGRNIHENISVASEMVNELKTKRKDGNLGLKLDITQAFDTVSWSFVLEFFGDMVFLRVGVLGFSQFLTRLVFLSFSMVVRRVFSRLIEV